MNAVWSKLISPRPWSVRHCVRSHSILIQITGNIRIHHRLGISRASVVVRNEGDLEEHSVSIAAFAESNVNEKAAPRGNEMEPSAVRPSDGPETAAAPLSREPR